MKMGKSAKTALIYAVVLSLLIGTAAFMYMSSAARLKVKLRFYPPRIDLGMPAPAELEATLELGKGTGYTAADIVVSTVLFEGVLAPQRSEVTTGSGEFLHAYFHGPTAIDIIWAKFAHMGIVNPDPTKYYKVALTITGELNDGTPFTTDRWVKILIPNSPPPPPP